MSRAEVDYLAAAVPSETFSVQARPGELKAITLADAGSGSWHSHPRRRR